MPENRISVYPFSIEQFIELVCPGATRTGVAIPFQVRYLAKYCGTLGAKTLLLEDHYIDRHYLDEFALYYSRMLSPPPNFVKRLHVFAASFSEEEFDEILRQSMVSENRRIEIERTFLATLENPLGGYLGFCAIRPIPSAPIGRTILMQLPPEEPPAREIWATNSHVVHLAGLCLKVEGLAFQQQDVAVGACATAALWSALVRVARQDGMRAPTPAEISDAATMNSRSGLRHMLSASGGMTAQELCQATRVLGFSPELISAWGRPEIFVTVLYTYLLSGIPVVLGLWANGSGHAVTAAGFKLFSEHPRLQGAIPATSAGMTKLYVHDDRIGPYARAYLEPVDFPSGDGNGKIDGLVFTIDWGTSDQQFVVDFAIAPVYPKLRLTVTSLIALADHLCGSLELMVGPDNASKLRVDFRYEKAGAYLASLSGRVHDRASTPAFVKSISLSRWCAVMRWYIGEMPLVEFIYDTTDIVRDVEIQNKELLRGIIWLSADYAENAQVFGEAQGVKFL